MEYCNYPTGSTLADERAANGSPEPFKVALLGRRQRAVGLRRQLPPRAGAADEYRQFANVRARLSAAPTALPGRLRTQRQQRPVDPRLHGYPGRTTAWTATPCTTTKTAPCRPWTFTPEAMYAQFNIFPRVEQAHHPAAHPPRQLRSRRAASGCSSTSGACGIAFPDDEERNGRLWQQATMRSAVAPRLGLNIFNRQADKLYMCNIAQMVNVLQSVLLTDGPEGRNCVRTTSYYAFMLFKPHRSKTAVHVEYDGYKLPCCRPARRGGRGKQPQPELLPIFPLSASRQGAEWSSRSSIRATTPTCRWIANMRGVTAREARAPRYCTIPTSTPITVSTTQPHHDQASRGLRGRRPPAGHATRALGRHCDVTSRVDLLVCPALPHDIILFPIPFEGACLAKESHGCRRRQCRRQLRSAHCRQGTGRRRVGGRRGRRSARERARYPPVRPGPGLRRHDNGRQRLRTDRQFRHRHHHRRFSAQARHEPRRSSDGQLRSGPHRHRAGREVLAQLHPHRGYQPARRHGAGGFLGFKVQQKPRDRHGRRARHRALPHLHRAGAEGLGRERHRRGDGRPRRHHGPAGPADQRVGHSAHRADGPGSASNASSTARAMAAPRS